MTMNKREDDAGGNHDRVCDDARKTGGGVPRTPKDHQRQEKFLAMMQRKRNLTREPLEALRKRIFQEIRDVDERISGEEI